MSALLKRARRFKRSVQDELGGDIKLFLNGVNQDDYGAIKGRTGADFVILRAYPIRLQPTLEQLAEAGVNLNTEATFPVTDDLLTEKGLLKNGSNKPSIDTTRAAIIFEGQQYMVTSIGRPHTINNISLAYVLGGNKK